MTLTLIILYGIQVKTKQRDHQQHATFFRNVLALCIVGGPGLLLHRVYTLHNSWTSLSSPLQYTLSTAPPYPSIYPPIHTSIHPFLQSCFHSYFHPGKNRLYVHVHPCICPFISQCSCLFVSQSTILHACLPSGYLHIHFLPFTDCLQTFSQTRLEQLNLLTGRQSRTRRTIITR